MKRVLLSALCIVFACQSPTWAQQFKVGDRVYITTIRKYGTVVPGGIQTATGVQPNIRLDDAPYNVTGGTIYDASSVVSAASVAPTNAQPGATSGYGAHPLGTPDSALTRGAAPQTETVADPPNSGGELPSGTYDCSKTSSGAGLRGFGSIEIKGGTYRGMDSTIGPFIPLRVTDGNIYFSGGLKGLEDLRITKSYISRNSSGQPIIVIRYSTTNRGFTSTGGFECVCQ